MCNLSGTGTGASVGRGLRPAPTCCPSRAVRLLREVAALSARSSRATAQVDGADGGPDDAGIELAIEKGADAEDTGLTIHPHPTLSETIAFSAEAFAGTITDLYLPKKR